MCVCVSELCVCECGAGGGREEGEEEAVRTEVRNQKRELHKDVGKKIRNRLKGLRTEQSCYGVIPTVQCLSTQGACKPISTCDSQ